MAKLENYFLKIKDRISSEQKFGGIKRACDNAGVTATTYHTALRRGSVDDLKDGELSAIREFIKILDERKASR